MNNEQQHWLVRPKTIRGLWIVFVAILTLTVAMDLFIDRHAHFGFDGLIGFSAWYGLGTCAVMIIGAKLLGFWLKRPDTYYDE